ncbi:MAG: hypothetical protein MPEBLZ_00530 [Candidatus Methanoperedens nitroreducens]|uniref:Uncharacterized protein n=1 Tax=Candidatus Methanoperedens nitratireducens TaxID=1392998 RepID=A0A0P8A987_9EURY|nr:hypothetical protein [Candidatus Methanoperedens sp. BLZ2]KPQ44851.1 MAG: hypothetical protein MPEBLZ_00530 [Candidatus Methanoperedens sp. BLZ1]MBZ0177190.1 hypothetical protein [Candidatus Methanoperedens nitroreducens]MCX9078862.1 hypothetical protein [Candidatus Methanoperedens sp.]CAG0983017.1 hypothetical protein METP1_01879 [Methanosarcinales archaeon]MCX9088645.1 hypothetical protein [Candidatus Methanoperedens sp.]
MELKEINVVEGIFQQIIEEPFADIAVDGEMDMERMRYLLSTDEMSEEILKIN